MEELSKKIGERIRELRNNKGLTQEGLAYHASLHDRYIGNIERGEKNPSLESLVGITKVLEISLEEFFSAIDPKECIENDELQEIFSLLKGRSAVEQKNILNVIKSIFEMVDNK